MWLMMIVMVALFTLCILQYRVSYKIASVFVFGECSEPVGFLILQSGIIYVLLYSLCKTAYHIALSYFF